MTDDATRLENDFPADEERTHLEDSESEKTRLEEMDPAETILEDGTTSRHGSFELVGKYFEGTDKTYVILEELEASGAEADIYIVQEQDSDDKHVLKYYRRGRRPKSEITEMLADLEAEHVVRFYETGEKNGRSFEIQEFVEHGSLADMVASGGLPDARMKEILHELLIAVKHLHECNIIHRDLKPANVLVRTLDPLDLVFIDFGIASRSELSLLSTSSNRTVSYGSPESLAGVVAKASDWWSVGVILLELLLGKHPFADLKEQAVNFQLVSKGIEVPDTLPDDLQLLIKGLLTRDHEKRWGEEQVQRWLEGDHSIAVGYDAEHSQEQEARKYDYKPYKFSGKEFYEPAALAVALGEHWCNALKNFGRGFVTEWVKKELGDIELTNHLMDVQEDETLDATQKLSVALMILNPEFPLLEQEGVVSRESLQSRANELEEILGGGWGRWLSDLRGEKWLLELGRDYEKFRKEINPHRKSLTEILANRLFLLTKDDLDEEWKQFRHQYGGCKIPALNRVFDMEKLPDRFEKILLLALRRELLEANKGDSYEGESRDGIPHGSGTCFFESGSRYKGGWRDGTRHGSGTYFFECGSRYEGEWREGHVCGKGTYFSAAGGLYEGELVEEFAVTGTGTYFFADGSRYESVFKEDFNPHGPGTFFFADGGRYEGELRDLKPHGNGTYLHSNGDRFEGEWKEGLKQCKGTWFHAEGFFYKGDLRELNPHGFGTYHYSNGDRYEGNWKKGLKHGTGTFFHATGKRYEGGWKEGKKHGKGTYFFKKADPFEGEWEAGVLGEWKTLEE